MVRRDWQSRPVGQRPVGAGQKLPQPLVGTGALELAEQCGYRGAPDGPPLFEPAEEGAQWLGDFAGAIEGEPRLEEVGCGLRPLAIDSQPKGVRLRVGAEAQGRCPPLRI